MSTIKSYIAVGKVQKIMFRQVLLSYNFNVFFTYIQFLDCDQRSLKKKAKSWCNKFKGG